MDSVIQTFGGIDSSARSRLRHSRTTGAAGCAAVTLGSGVGNISDQGNLPNVIVSNNTGETTYTSASALLAK